MKVFYRDTFWDEKEYHEITIEQLQLFLNRCRHNTAISWEVYCITLDKIDNNNFYYSRRCFG